MSVSPTRPGQLLGLGDARSQFIRVFSGEVITQFEAKTLMKGLMKTRTVTKARSARFPVFGQLGAQYHVVGSTALSGASQNSRLISAERNIEVDNILEAHTYIADFDEAMAEMDLRSMYSTELSNALSRQYDQRAIRVLINVARERSLFGVALNPATGQAYFGGGAFLADGSPNTFTLNRTPLTPTNVANFPAAAGTELTKTILDSAQILDDKFVEDSNRVCLVRPDMYWLLIRNHAQTLNQDWGGQGSLATGSISMLGNIRIQKTSNLPVVGAAASTIAANHPTEGTAGTSGTANLRTAVGTETGAVSCYTGVFARTRAVVFTPCAIGTVNLREVKSEQQRFAQFKADFLGVDYMAGHGFLRPECAVEITSAIP